MNRSLELRLDKLIDDVIVKGSLRAAINGLVFEMNEPISGIRYLGHSIPTFALPYYRNIDQGKLSEYGERESEELMEKAYRFSIFIRDNEEYTKQLYDSFNRELKLLESKFCNDSVFKEEKSKARRLLKAGFISSHIYQNLILKKLEHGHKKYNDKLFELKYEYNTKIAHKIGHCSTYACEDLENLLRYYNNIN